MIRIIFSLPVSTRSCGCPLGPVSTPGWLPGSARRFLPRSKRAPVPSLPQPPRALLVPCWNCTDGGPAPNHDRRLPLEWTCPSPGPLDSEMEPSIRPQGILVVRCLARPGPGGVQFIRTGASSNPPNSWRQTLWALRWNASTPLP